MTLRLRKKRQITAHGMSISARTAVSLFALVLLLAGRSASAQDRSFGGESGTSTWKSTSGPTNNPSPQIRTFLSGEEVIYYQKDPTGVKPEGPALKPARSAPSIPQAKPETGFSLPSHRQHSRQIALLQEGDRRTDATEGSTFADIPLEAPGKDRLFQLESEKSLKERMRQSARDKGEPTIFPKEPVI